MQRQDRGLPAGAPSWQPQFFLAGAQWYRHEHGGMVPQALFTVEIQKVRPALGQLWSCLASKPGWVLHLPAYIYRPCGLDFLDAHAVAAGGNLWIHMWSSRTGSSISSDRRGRRRLSPSTCVFIKLYAVLPGLSV